MSSQIDRPGARRGHVASFVSIAIAGALAAQSAYAQTADQPTDEIQDDTSMGTVLITAKGSQVDLPPDYAGAQIARGGRIGLFGNLDVMDTPFNTTNYTAELMRNVQARSVADVVQSDPAVRVARGFGNFQELYFVRGFPVYSDDMSYNGLYGLLPRQYVAAEFLERVEVFRGANSFLNGAAPGGSGIGGSFNLVPKRAPDRSLSRVTLGFANEGEGLAAADFARRLGDDGKFGMRANAVRRDGDTSIDDESRELSVLSLGMDYRGELVRFSADLGWQDHRIDAPRPSVTPVGAVPAEPEASSNFAQKWTFTSEEDLFGVVRGELNLTELTSLWAAVGLRDSEEHNVLSNPSADASGATSSYRFDNFREDRVTTGEIGLRTEVETGAVGHRLSTSASVFEIDSKNAYGFSDFAGFAGSLYNPVDVIAPSPNFFTGGVLFSPLTTNKTETFSVAVADTLVFADERVLFTAGARYQNIEQQTYDYNTGIAIPPGYDESAVTPIAAIVIKPSAQYSFYANYAEGLIQGDIAPAVIGTTPVSNVNEVFEPSRSKQMEVGVKYDRRDVGGTLALFQVKKPSARLDGTIYRVDGEQRNRGIELSWYGEPLSTLRILGGITLLNTEESTANGNDVIGVPEKQANIGVEWDVSAARGFTLDGRVVYTGSQAVNAANTVNLPSWTRLDLGARYALTVAGKDVAIRARVDNVTDRDYWASAGGSPGSSYLVLAAPRTFALSTSIDF